VDKIMKRVAYLTILLALPFISLAADDAEKDFFTGSTELGYVATSGNTENTSFDFKFDGTVSYARMAHQFIANAYFASESGTTTGERYLAAYKPKWTIDERNYAWGLLRYTDDRFSGYKYQASETVGYGYKFLIGPKHYLNGEVGVGARQQETDSGEYDSRPVAQLDGSYKYQFSKTSSFVQNLGIIHGTNNTEVSSFTGVKAAINSSLSLTVGLDVKYNSDAPDDKENTDTKTTANIVYNF
jgi:putative salt-induced outer membrane protein